MKIKKDCLYCKNKIKNLPFMHSNSETNGVHVAILDNKLSAYGWYDEYGGIQEISKVINYCPMCGRELMKG